MIKQNNTNLARDVQPIFGSNEGFNCLDCMQESSYTILQKKSINIISTNFMQVLLYWVQRVCTLPVHSDKYKHNLLEKMISCSGCH